MNLLLLLLDTFKLKEETKDYIQHSRRQFMNARFSENDAKDNPIDQFSMWFENAVSCGIRDPFALTLATANKNGIPSARVVYMRDVTERGLVFFTNYLSHKGHDLFENPYACANFYWEDLSRQVRFTGRVEKVDISESDSYFDSRPRESQIGAWASNQSRKLNGREELISKLDALKIEFEGRDVPRPEHWGGYVIIPSTVEFWQGRESRLHDRILYERDENGNWAMSRLSP